MVPVVNDLFYCHDLDLGGPSLASFMLVATLIFLIMILIFMVLVVAIGDIFGFGFSYNWW